MARYCAIKTDGVGSVLVKSEFRWPVLLASSICSSDPFKHNQQRTTTPQRTNQPHNTAPPAETPLHLNRSGVRGPPRRGMGSAQEAESRSHLGVIWVQSDTSRGKQTILGEYQHRASDLGLEGSRTLPPLGIKAVHRQDATILRIFIIRAF